MAKKKTLVPFGIFFIVISLFFIFKFSFVLGALLLATGIIALVYSKKNKFIPIVPAVFSLIFILLIIGFRAILATASQIIIFIDNESIYSSTTALAEFIDYMMYDPYDFLYLFEDLESLPYIYLADHQLRVAMLSTLGLSLILYILNVVLKNNVFKTILNIVVVLFSIGIFVNSIHNVFIPLYGYAVFTSNEGSYAYMINNIIFGKMDFEYVASLLVAKMTLKEFAIVSFVSIIIPFSTLVLAFISSGSKCKKDKCCHHQEVVQEEQPIVEEK